MSLAKYVKIFAVQVRNNWVREVIYRTNFITAAIVDLVWIFVEATFFTVIYSHTRQMGGWTLPQIYFFLGVFFSSDALFTIFFNRNFWTFSDLISKGELDVFLTKPANPGFLVFTRAMNLTAFTNLLLGLVIIARYSHAAGFVGGWHWLEVALWLLIGLASQVLLRFAFAVWVFWTERGFALSALYYRFFTVATKPDSIYPKFIRYVILSALPFAFIGSVPARALMQGLSVPEYIDLIVVLGFLMVFDQMVWKLGLKRYQSASS